MQQMRSRGSGMVRLLLREHSRYSDHAIASIWQPEPLKAANISLAVRSFARQRRRAHESHEDPLLDITEPDNDTYAAHEELQPVPDAPGGPFRPSSEQMWPTSRNQKKYGARVRDALHTVMMGSGAAAYERLVWQLGFTIVEVRTSPDNMTAYVLWDAHDDRLYSAEREISHRMSQLRRDMGRLLGMRRTPRLEFRLDRLSQDQKDVEDALERLKADSCIRLDWLSRDRLSREQKAIKNAFETAAS